MLNAKNLVILEKEEKMGNIKQDDGWKGEESTDKSYQIACLFGTKRAENDSYLFYLNLANLKKKILLHFHKTDFIYLYILIFHFRYFLNRYNKSSKKN